MNVLVLGGCGYKGTVLTQALLEAGHRVTVFDIMWFGNFLAPHENLQVVRGDIRQCESVPMAGQDAVIHLANVANDPCGELDARLSWEVNVLATMGLVESAIGHGVGQFIYASSGSVYGVKEEEKVTEDLPLVPISDYNKTKMISERVLLSYADRIAVQIVRPATVCGYSPRQRLDVAVNLLTMLALKNGKITVFGGDQMRPNIHIKDVVRVYLHLLARPELTGIYNAGFEDLTILQTAEMIAETIGAEMVVTPSNDPRSYRQNSDKILSTGFVPQYSVADGVQDIIDGFRDGRITDTDMNYNVRAMKKLGQFQGA